MKEGRNVLIKCIIVKNYSPRSKYNWQGELVERQTSICLSPLFIRHLATAWQITFSSGLVGRSAVGHTKHSSGKTSCCTALGQSRWNAIRRSSVTFRQQKQTVVPSPLSRWTIRPRQKLQFGENALWHCIRQWLRLGDSGKPFACDYRENLRVSWWIVSARVDVLIFTDWGRIYWVLGTPGIISPSKSESNRQPVSGFLSKRLLSLNSPQEKGFSFMASYGLGNEEISMVAQEIPQLFPRICFSFEPSVTRTRSHLNRAIIFPV